MPMYDLVCSNQHQQRDVLLRLGERPPCPECGAPTETLWDSPSGVIQDSIEGGLEVVHGLCWDDGRPRKFYSKSEMARVAKEKGLVNLVRHIGAHGSDKAPHGNTTRWI
jgi:hypothetical protein